MEKKSDENNRSFSLDCIQIKGWPKLAWVADFFKGGKTVRVRHGSHVEIQKKWCVEGVWGGQYEKGGFDRTEIFFGSGIRLRDKNVYFISAGTMLDRLWHVEIESCFYVSNSLPALLAVADINLDNEYLYYSRDIESLVEGIDGYKKEIPARPKPVNVLYYRNLMYNEKELIEINKPYSLPEFKKFSDYYQFLVNTSKNLGTNLRAALRKFKITPLGCVSSGYDSGAATVIAKEAGCETAVTIENASSLFPRKDSGEAIANHLDLKCHVYQHSSHRYRHEIYVWCAAGMPAGLNLSIFDYPDPLCLFFTGYRGDTIWDDYVSNDHRTLSAPTISGLGLCEFRLLKGIFHCPVPCLGEMNTRDIQLISKLPEMDPWRLNRPYNRPIPRRILEEASVPRALFGNRKEATTVDNFFLWPFSKQAIDSFENFLKPMGLMFFPHDVVELMRLFAKLSNVIYANMPKRIRSVTMDPRRLFSIKSQTLLFQWSNSELKKMYKIHIEEKLD